MNKRRPGIQFSAAHTHGQHAVLTIGIKPESWYVHNHIFVMFLRRIRSLPSAALYAAQHFLPLLPLRVLCAKVIHQLPVHLPAWLNIIQELPHTVMIHYAVGLLVVSNVWMAHFHVKHMIVGDMRGIRIFHGTMIERIIRIHITEMLTTGIPKISPCEIELQPRHHLIDIFLVCQAE